LAVSAAGTGAQMIGQNEAQSARESAQRAEMNRQSGYRKNAQAVVDQSIAESGRDTADPAIAAGADNRVNRFNSIIQQGQTPPTGNTVNRSVVTTAGRPTPTMTASAQAWNRILGNRQAKLGGYADWGLARNVAAQRAGQKLGNISTDARNSAQILSADMQDANSAGDGWNMAGQVLGALGTVGGAYAATMPAAGAGAATGFGSSVPQVDTMDRILGDAPLWGGR
jgi:hypothetical protein